MRFCIAVNNSSQTLLIAVTSFSSLFCQSSVCPAGSLLNCYRSKQDWNGKISGSHGGEFEYGCRLGCCAV
jgi:hypothetical protein